MVSGQSYYRNMALTGDQLLLHREPSQAESRYAQIEKEALALTWSCEKFSNYVLGAARNRSQTTRSHLGSQESGFTPSKSPSFSTQTSSIYSAHVITLWPQALTYLRMSQSKQGTTVQSKSTMCVLHTSIVIRGCAFSRCWHSQSIESQCKSKSFVRNR